MIEMEVVWAIYGANLAIILGCMICLWVLSLALKNASIVDIFWGPGFVIIAWLTYGMAEGYLGRKILICTLVTVWGLRLAIHIARRNWGKGEDRRDGDGQHQRADASLGLHERETGQDAGPTTTSPMIVGHGPSHVDENECDEHRHVGHTIEEEAEPDSNHADQDTTDSRPYHAGGTERG